MTKKQIAITIEIIRKDISVLYDQCDADQQKGLKESLQAGLKDIDDKNGSKNDVKPDNELKHKCRLCLGVFSDSERIEHMISKHLERFFYPLTKYKTIIEENTVAFDQAVNEYCEYMESRGLVIKDFRTIADTHSQSFMAFILYEEEKDD